MSIFIKAKSNSELKELAMETLNKMNNILERKELKINLNETQIMILNKDNENITKEIHGKNLKKMHPDEGFRNNYN